MKDNVINILEMNTCKPITSKFYIGQEVYVIEQEWTKSIVQQVIILAIGVVHPCQDDLIYICDRNLHKNHKVYYQDEIFPTLEEAYSFLIDKLQLNVKYLIKMHKITTKNRDRKDRKSREKHGDIKINLDKEGIEKLY